MIPFNMKCPEEVNLQGQQTDQWLQGQGGGLKKRMTADKPSSDDDNAINYAGCINL